MLPHYLAIGVTKNEFMHSSPRTLKAYDLAFDEKIKIYDELAWQFCGSYVLSAVSVAVEHCLAGRKARSKYMEQAVTRELQEKKAVESGNLSEEELQKQRELFMAKLMVMQSNFEIYQKNKENNENFVD